MLREEIQLVRIMITEEIAKIKFPEPKPPKPVDIDGIVKLVLIKLSTPAAEIPKKGKEK